MNKREYCEQPLSVEGMLSHDSIKPIMVYVDNHIWLEKINTPQHWWGLEELAERESEILHIYRGCRLVRVVRPSNLKEKLYAA